MTEWHGMAWWSVLGLYDNVGIIYQVVVPHLAGSYVGRTKAVFCDSPPLLKATHLLGTLPASLESTYSRHTTYFARVYLPTGHIAHFAESDTPARPTICFAKQILHQGHITCFARSDSITRHCACFPRSNTYTRQAPYPWPC